MEFTDDQLIDVGLNLAGYIAAALFSLVIYSIYFGRKVANLEDAVRCAAGWTESPGFDSTGKRIVNEPGREFDLGSAHESAIGASRLNSSSTDNTVYDRDVTRAEFLDFGARTYSETGPAPDTGNYQGNPDRFSRNRSEVIRLARKMLEAGNPVERVSDLLPISESEMRLVQLGSQARSSQVR